ncbi:hypothetical protein [Streptomyces alanosinicus]|uniref:Uncharacterized protein n=1 Tax=Streptomyces alanosinicus TaxID=68171 RepID=A0A919D4B9_9ACTN|nr:hypothetical protein [Streptomyces alanosinicus]GHE06374.1 hypothetical protein GCM10010339_46350 [Streptomyces alanosinicus]
MRCWICGSARLSPVGELTSGERAFERLRLKFRRPGFFKPQPEFEASRARACRDCGALFPFLTEYDRRELDAAADDLAEADDAAPYHYGPSDSTG